MVSASGPLCLLFSLPGTLFYPDLLGTGSCLCSGLSSERPSQSHSITLPCFHSLQNPFVVSLLPLWKIISMRTRFYLSCPWNRQHLKQGLHSGPSAICRINDTIFSKMGEENPPNACHSAVALTGVFSSKFIQEQLPSEARRAPHLVLKPGPSCHPVAK